jgi:arylsulfatase A-like enzyme
MARRVLLARWLVAPLLALAGGVAAAAQGPSFVVVVSDDQGHADLGVQGAVEDVRTPHIDALAASGVRMAQAYVAAPQCVPSRAALLTGRYPQRFGLEVNAQGPLPLEELTIAERLAGAGYVSGMVGKWHLDLVPRKEPGGPSTRRPAAAAGTPAAAASDRDPRFLPGHQGFDEFFEGASSPWLASHDLAGRHLADEGRRVVDARFRIDVQTDAAVSFLRRHAGDRFFLYVAYSAPHVPLEAAERHLARFPHATGKRKLALAMLAAVDDGVGRIVSTLRELGIRQDTLVLFLSDHGAPLQERVSNGSLNLPLVGEKGMLTEGGIRVPFVASWPARLPAGLLYEPPVFALDVAATLLAAAGVARPPDLDGVDLTPCLTGRPGCRPHAALFWRWRSQSAVRKGRWKLVKVAGTRDLLFDLESDEGERRNILGRHPTVAASLDAELRSWAAGLAWPGLVEARHPPDATLYDAHFP